MSDENKQFYQIGEVSKLCNISIKTLRYYDEIELLKPRKIDQYSNYRYYSHDQLILLLAIKYFKEAGFSLKEIKILLGREDLKYNQKKISEKCIEIDDKINDLLRLKGKLNFCLNEVQRGKDLNEEGVIKEKYIPETYIAYLREKGPVNVEGFSVRYCKLMSLIEKSNLHTTKNVMALYYDSCIEFEDRYKRDYDIEVCAAVTATTEIPGVTRKFGGFKAVSAIHYGKYDGLVDLYRKMYRYIKEKQYEICGPAIDNYLVDIMNTADENNYITELLVPIK